MYAFIIIVVTPRLMPMFLTSADKKRAENGKGHDSGDDDDDDRPKKKSAPKANGKSKR